MQGFEQRVEFVVSGRESVIRVVKGQFRAGRLYPRMAVAIIHRLHGRAKAGAQGRPLANPAGTEAKHGGL